MDDQNQPGKPAANCPKYKKATLSYPGHHFTPVDILHFIELKQFTKRWKGLELDDEGDLLALQLMIMADPRGAPVIEGTNGLRKMRFAPSRWNSGKSGAARVLYVLFEKFGVVLLALIYGKNEADSISPAVKTYLNKLISEIESELIRRQWL